VIARNPFTSTLKINPLALEISIALALPVYFRIALPSPIRRMRESDHPGAEL
jgi:hypothetical protein